MTETRAEKAQRLVDEGRVRIIAHWNGAVQAEVKGSRGLYTTFLYTNGHYCCDCPWGHYHSHTDNLCAHALAVKLMTEKEN